MNKSLVAGSDGAGLEARPSLVSTPTPRACPPMLAQVLPLILNRSLPHLPTAPRGLAWHVENWLGPWRRGHGRLCPGQVWLVPGALTELPATGCPCPWGLDHWRLQSLEVSQALGTAPCPWLSSLPQEKDVFLGGYLVSMLLIYYMKKAGYKINLTLWLVNMYMFIV